MSILSEIFRDSGVTKATLGSKFFAIFIALAFGGAGLFLFTLEFLNPYLESRQAKDWIHTDAIVLKSELITDDGTTNIDLNYLYQHDGKTYENDRFELSEAGRNFSTETFEETARNHPTGSTIPIWLNPENPQQSVVKKDMVFTHWMALFFALPFLTVGLCALLYVLFNGVAFRIQKRAWLDAAQIANRQSAHEISKHLTDENLNNHSYIKINFLKQNHLLSAIGYLALNLFANGIIAVFVIVAIGSALTGGSLLWLVLVTPMAIFGILLLIKFFKTLFKAKGDDYVIISEWDEDYTWVKHSWLLLSESQNAAEFSIATTTANNTKAHKKLLKNKPLQTTHTAPGRSTITGTITHPIQGSAQKEIYLLAHTRSNLTKKTNQHIIPIHTPDNT